MEPSCLGRRPCGASTTGPVLAPQVLGLGHRWHLDQAAVTAVDLGPDEPPQDTFAGVVVLRQQGDQARWHRH